MSDGFETCSGFDVGFVMLFIGYVSVYLFIHSFITIPNTSIFLFWFFFFAFYFESPDNFRKRKKAGCGGVKASNPFGSTFFGSCFESDFFFLSFLNVVRD